MPAWRIPLSDLDLDGAEQEAVARVIRSRWLTLGEEVAGFEREFAEYCGVDESVALSSCTAALHLACVALGVEPGDEVIVPTLTFVATASAVALAGGRPVFADSIGPADLTIDPADVERRITSATKGLICVHYGGYPCRLDELLNICERHDLFLIEDAAHAPGARYAGRALGTFGDVGCFSFFGNKNMTTGEGGAAIARDPAIAERIRLLRAHGMTTSSWDRFLGHAVDYDVVEPGFNYRPNELAMAVGREQLRKLTINNARRNQRLEQYWRRLGSAPGITLPFAGSVGSAHLAVVIARTPELREALRGGLRKAGIQSSVHYRPIHLFAHYRSACGYGPGDLPIAEDVATRALTLPLFATMSPEQVDEVCDCVLAVVSDTTSDAEADERSVAGP